MRDLLAQRLDSLSQCFVICRPKSAPMRYSDQRMGYNARNDEIRDNITRMKRAWADQRQTLATVRRFNAANGNAWFWPQDCRGAHFKASLARCRLRQLRDRG